METAAEVLLIIVSIVLSIFLLVLIVALIYIISVMRQVRRISTKAENVADSVEEAASTFGRRLSLVPLLRLIGKFAENSSNNRRKKG